MRVYPPQPIGGLFVCNCISLSGATLSCGLNPGITVSALQMTPFEAASSMPDHKQGKGGGFGICVELHGFREGGPQLIHSLLRTAQ
jgi:hypothetical protein